MVLRRASSLANRPSDIAYLLNTSLAGRNYEPVWRSIDPSQVHFIAGELDREVLFIGKEWRTRLAIQYYEIKNSGHAFLIEAPLEEDSVIVKTLSQKIMPPIDVLKPVPSESRPKLLKQNLLRYTLLRIGQLKLCHL